MTTFAKTVSYIFHPLLMPTIALLVLFDADTYIRFSTEIELRHLSYLLVFSTTFIFPMFVSVMLLKNKRIMSLEMETADERVLPLFMTLIFYVVTFFLIKRAGLSYLIYTSFLAATLTVFLVFIIYLILKWKISAHMAGIGGVIGAIIAFSIKLSANMVFYLMLFIMLAGILGYARLKLKAHSPAQIYIGFVLGLVTQLLLLL